MSSPSTFKFSSLPKEIQIRIWELASESVGSEIVRAHPRSEGRSDTDQDYWMPSLAVSGVNYLSRVIQPRPIAPAIFTTRAGGKIHLDLASDTIKIINMWVPAARRTPAWPSTRPTQEPIRKLLCHAYSTHLYKHTDPFLGPMPFVNQFPNPRMVSRIVRLRGFEMHWPELREFTLAITRADIMWYLKSYQVQGPDMNSSGTEDNPWHEVLARSTYVPVDEVAPNGSLLNPKRDYATCFDKSKKGAKYYAEKGIEVDTGIRWSADRLQSKGSKWASRRQRTILTMPPHIRHTLRTEAYDFRVNIGLRAFSMNSTSYGGMWAGFRYYPDAQPYRIEFSPLSWEDVKDTTFECRNIGAVKDHFPEMIIKLWVIKEGEEVPPVAEHACWEDVTPGGVLEEMAQNGNTDAYKIRCMWWLLKKALSESMALDTSASISLLG